MIRSQISAHVASFSTTLSPYPASFNNDPWRYGLALASLLAISMFGASVAGWMARDIWRDRFREHPTSAVFLFRLMVMTVGFTALIRCLPEVVYMTLYGEVTGDTMASILTVKRTMDVMALPSVIGWTSLLVIVYPHVVISLKSSRMIGILPLDPLSQWHRFVRPFFILVCILFIAFLMSYAKGALGHSVT
jgi:hypothetical protein